MTLFVIAELKTLVHLLSFAALFVIAELVTLVHLLSFAR